MNVIFYSTHCPQCRGLEMLLKNKKVEYTVCDDTEEMIRIGLQSAPALSVDGKIMTYAESIKWLQGLGK